MASIDSNTWYQLTETRVDFTSSLQYQGKDIFFAAANDNAQQYWQFFPLPDGNYQLRNRGTDSKQLGTCYKSSEKSTTKTQPCMIESSDDPSQKWIVDQWSDGNFKFVNVRNGTGYNMDVHPGNPLFMSPITAEEPIQPAQHWQMKSRELINDGTFSTAFGAAAASSSSSAFSTSTSTPTSSKTTPSKSGASQSAQSTGPSGSALTIGPTSDEVQTSTAQPHKSGGIHTGAAVGIGIGIGLAVCILAALFLLLRRRSAAKSNRSGMAHELPTDEMRKGSTYTVGKSDVSSVSIQEVPANGVERHEMYAMPPEMPGNHEFVRQPWHAHSPMSPSPP